MDLIEATLNKKRSALEAATGGTKKKYIRRGDLEKQREQQYLEEQERERKEKEERERKLVEERETKRKADLTAKSSSSTSASPPPSADSTSSTSTTTTLDAAAAAAAATAEAAASAATFNIPPEEVVRRLRARGQPIRLFAETDQQRKIRLRALELVEDRSEGQRNDFMRALENAETGLHMEALGKDAKDKKPKVDPTKDLDMSEISTELLQKDQDKLYVLIYTYFKRLLREWERDLDQRPDEVKRSTAGKLATATQAQSADYLKPFFRLLRQKSLEPDVLARITEIAELMIKREYMAASDAYLKLSIGNAPWPIGVTMVGIHERSGREKIFSAQVAHVLNDETSRKWIQSIKRIMTFTEKKYPR
ncbi:Prp18 domain-containing protein [Gamsiella multidivaricata]|uniref:Prp18 domain-containing protein n=1 Tax=Gamsiella multidivaricata TaxID=101098 RepID=UPI0022204F7B|nr:Prp18 domain-containing protein [Gamsiella multidivaricata]KAG0367623.1 mRNA splicing protein prp18 [Gamsiella multidivaricata]KAI7819224.1 Prp18 domain-containing protein [Gamsiella multidivaricata]